MTIEMYTAPHPWEAVTGKVTQQPPDLTKIWANQVQAMEAEDEARAVVEEELVTKDVDNEDDFSTAQHTCHLLKTSREK